MQHYHFNILSRRSFLSKASKVGMAAAFASLIDIPFVMKRALAEGIGVPGPDGKIKKLLFIWLRGANDGLNSIVPVNDPAYYTSRPTGGNNIGIPMDAGTNYATTGGLDFYPAGANSTYGAYPFAIRSGNGFCGLHPSLKFLAPIYNAGDLALIHRVGYPRQSRSHFDSQNYWENGYPNNNVIKNGIFYRTMYESGLANSAPLTGVSIQSALPLILRGDEAAMTNLTDPERYALLGIPNDTNGVAKAYAHLSSANTAQFASKTNRDLLQLQYQNLSGTLSLFDSIDFDEAHNTFRDDVKTDGDAGWYPQGQANNDALGYYLFPTTNNKNGGWLRPDGTQVFNKYSVNPAHQSFFKNLKAAALVLNKTDAIIAGTELGGFDTHSGQGGIAANNGGGANNHPDLNRAIGWAMYGLYKYFTNHFDRATWNNVVVVTLSEFGRTTRQNSDLGTDHAEANVMWVAGGAVKGYQAGSPSGVFNCSPSDGIPWVTGGSGSMFGVSVSYLKLTTDDRSVLGEIIRKHLGATQAQLNRIIPGYANEAQEHLLSGGTVMAPIESGTTTTPIRGEVGIL
jgi:uncharacterized protein (DUF1501 family)